MRHRAIATLLLAMAIPMGVKAQEHHRDTVVVVHRDTVWYMPRSERARHRTGGWFRRDEALRRPVAAVRTDLLMPLLNAGAEFPLSNRWSVGGDIFFPWVSRRLMDAWYEPHRYCLQGLGAVLEGRLWLGAMHRRGEEALSRYRLLGHSLALVAGGAYYDVQDNWTGRQGELYAAGLDYMYAMPLGRKCWGHLEFEIALGLAFHVQHPYAVYDGNGYLIRDKDDSGMPVRSITGWLPGVPVKAGVNLVIPLRTSLPLRPREGARR